MTKLWTGLDDDTNTNRYLHSEECRVEEDLLTAFRDFRLDLLAATQNDRCLRRLEPPVVKLAKSLRIDDDDEGDGGVVERPITPRCLRVKLALF